MSQKPVRIAVEDELSEVVIRKVIAVCAPHLSVHEGVAINYRGFGGLKKNLDKFREASKHLPHIVVRDLDQYPCPPALLKDWSVAAAAPHFLFRVAVRETEAWVLGDQASLIRYFQLPQKHAPAGAPESLRDPKADLLAWIACSKQKKKFSGMLPPKGSGIPIGTEYNRILWDFVGSQWNPMVAAATCPSLKRAIDRIRYFQA